MNPHKLAFDKSVRHKDADGKMFVDCTPISKACVSPYLGHEIPNGDVLGLVPDKIYMLLRCPLELAKAAPSFRGLPVLIVHKATSADDHPRELTVGTTGTEVEFNDPYLEVALNIWDAEAIVGIESKMQTEISSGYRYRADMTPGEYDGVAYDGVMRDIQGNHVALVEVGRAGPDVVVMDEQPISLRGKKMHKLTSKGMMVAGAVRAFLGPRLAQDAAIGSLATAFASIKAGALSTQIPHIIKAVGVATKGKLAADAKLDGMDAELAKLAKNEDKEIAEDDMDDAMASDEDEDDEDEKKKKKVAEDDMPDSKDAPKITKAAMDAAVNAGVAEAVDRINKLHAARQAVFPLVGNVALDSADAVYKFALDHLGVDTEGMPAAGYPKMLKLATESKPTAASPIALDSAASTTIAKQLAATNRIKSL